MPDSVTGESADRESWAQFVNAVAGTANDIAQLATHTPTRVHGRGGSANGKSFREHMRRGEKHLVKLQGYDVKRTEAFWQVNAEAMKGRLVGPQHEGGDRRSRQRTSAGNGA